MLSLQRLVCALARVSQSSVTLLWGFPLISILSIFSNLTKMLTTAQFFSQRGHTLRSGVQ